MNEPKQTALSGRSVKSPAKPESKNNLNLFEVRDYIESLLNRWPCALDCQRAYIRWTARAIKGLQEPIQSATVRHQLYEIDAHARLLKAGTVEQLEVIQQSVRHRIMYPPKGEQKTEDLWRALWSGLMSVRTESEMIALGNCVAETTARLLQLIRRSQENQPPWKGGSATQRWAWTAADQ